MTSITRQGSTQNVETQFYVTENDVVVEAQKTSSTFNRLKTSALSAFLNQTVSTSGHSYYRSISYTLEYQVTMQHIDTYSGFHGELYSDTS